MKRCYYEDALGCFVHVFIGSSRVCVCGIESVPSPERRPFGRVRLKKDGIGAPGKSDASEERASDESQD